jgi:hypothetical protein
MTDKEYFSQIAAALHAVNSTCAKYLEKNPNAKYTDALGKERTIAFAIDIMRQHEKVLREAAEKEDSNAT